MAQVVKIANVGFTTPNRDLMTAYYTETLGLKLASQGDDGLFLGSGNDHHSIALYPGAGSGIAHITFQIRPDGSLKEVAAQLERAGIPGELMSDAQPGIAELLQITDPSGNTLQLYQSAESAGHGISTTGIAPNKLGHLALCVDNIDAMVAFYETHLGFRVSDWMEHFFVFLRCGPDHHTVNFIDTGKRKLHHIAFQLRDFAHVQGACDHLAKQRIPLLWGPGRHGLGHNIFTYHNNPDEQKVELFTQLDTMLDESLGYFEPRPWHEDYPQRPKVWSFSPAAANTWGIMPPDGFMERGQH